jgi:hypothetical protein
MAVQDRTDVLSLLGQLQNHVTGAREVMRQVKNQAECLPVAQCDAALLLLNRADELHTELCQIGNASLASLDEREFILNLAGARDLMRYGAENDRGNDDPDSGLTLAATLLAIGALEKVDDIIEGVRWDLNQVPA